MTSLEQAEGLRQQAIALLITDRNAIEEQLAKLGYDGTITTVEIKKDRKPKTCSLCHQPGHIAKTCSATQAATT